MNTIRLAMWCVAVGAATLMLGVVGVAILWTWAIAFHRPSIFKIDSGATLLIGIGIGSVVIVPMMWVLLKCMVRVFGDSSVTWLTKGLRNRHTEDNEEAGARGR